MSRNSDRQTGSVTELEKNYSRKTKLEIGNWSDGNHEVLQQSGSEHLFKNACSNISA